MEREKEIAQIEIDNFKYLIGYLDKAIRPLVLIMPKMSGYVKTINFCLSV